MADWFQGVVFIGLLLIATPLLGHYLYHIFKDGPTPLTHLLGWLETCIYRLCGVRSDAEMIWQDYAKALLWFNLAGLIFLFLLQIIQEWLPLNPQHYPGVEWTLALNTAISFVTNTNWQAYGGENSLSYLTQMLGMTVQNFVSAATGCAVLLAFIRGIVRKSMETIGNFWVDLTRTIVYLLLPFCFVFALILVSQGVIQTLSPYIQTTTLENAAQTIPLGPVASQVAIKQLGTNGGGYFNANSAHPSENPTPLSNFLEVFAIFLIPAASTYMYGLMVKSRKEGLIIFFVMFILWMGGLAVSLYSESLSNPVLGINPVLEGQEVRTGTTESILWAVTTTGTSNGSVNSMHSSLSPLAGGMALFNIMIGEVIFGGVGVGLCGMLMFILLTVFLSGLMVGRTPEYHGKKIEKTEMQWVMLSLLTPGALILLGSGFSSIFPVALESLGNKGPHGLSEILYAFSSAAGNNGSAFAGLNATAYYNLVLGAICSVGDIIPSDGEVVEGLATVDESAITGESAPAIRECGGDRSAVTAGTRVVSDSFVVLVTSEKGHSFLDRMINLIEGAQRQKTPNEIALNIVLSALTVIFILTVMSVKTFADYSGKAAGQDISHLVTIPVLIALLICLIPTTISALLSAIGIAGMDRLIQRNVIAKSGRSVEAAGDIDLLILDKTGTITLGNRMAAEFIPVPELHEKDFAQIAQLASLSDETPEGRSIVVLAKNKFDIRSETLDDVTLHFVPFSAHTQMSGVDVLDRQGKIIRIIRKGSINAIQNHIEKNGGVFPAALHKVIEPISNQGGTPLLVSDGNRIVGVIHLKDIIKGGIKERFAEMRKMGIRTLMVTGDNPLTAGAIAAEAGVDDFVAQATPEMKLARIRQEQQKGYLIAMTGDGTNDAPALAQSDVGVAMNTGTQASREAGNMVDLDSNPTKLLDIVEIGKQLLITRGALTTFSIANDVAKYFAIIPAIFGTLYLASGQPGPLNHLNIMHLHSPQSAILSAIIFNALIIIALIPLALRGVSYRPQAAYQLLRHNLLVYGLGGIAAPFIGIKLIDLFITAIGLIS